MSSTTAGITIEGDCPFHGTILSTTQIVESQEVMVCKINEASSDAMEKMLQRNTVAMEKMLEIINTQAQNQKQLLGMLTTRSGINDINEAGVSGEAVDSSIAILDNNHNPTLLDDNIEQVDQEIVECSSGQCPVTRAEGCSQFTNEIEANLYGTALSTFQQHGGSFKEWPIFHPLLSMANKPFAFFSGSNLTWWERCIYSRIAVDIDHPHDYAIIRIDTNRDEENPPAGCKETMRKYIFVHFKRYLMLVPCIKRIYHQKLVHKQAVALIEYLFFHLAEKFNDTGIIESDVQKSKFELIKTAMKYGNTEFALECLKAFPELLSFDMGKQESVFKLAIEERNERVFNFICEEREKKGKKYARVASKWQGSILHYAAELPTTRQLNFASCEAFQMQSKMQWFKGVESYMLQKDRFVRNSDGNTAHNVFMENHKELMEKGEKWMKDTSGSCMLVGALVATVSFAAAITVPGGNISDNNNSSKNGIPAFLAKKLFMVFAIADALSLFSSVTSVLMFLAVYTSRYSAEDFLKSLPQKLIIGLGTLFVSLASILVSFGAAFTVVLGNRFKGAPIFVGVFGGVPVFLFGILQVPLLFQMIHSTYRPIRFWKQSIVKEETELLARCRE